MDSQTHFWVVGGDLRQAYLAQLLALDGHRVSTFALERGMHVAPDAQLHTVSDGVAQSECVILPMPVCDADGMLYAPLCDRTVPLSRVLECCSSHQLICGGRLTDVAHTCAGQYGLTVQDYFVQEELTVLNAVPTAEGSLAIAMEELPTTVHGARVLIIGFGRVGTVTAQRFSALGAQVCVAARNDAQLAWASASGFHTERIEHLSRRLGSSDLVVNTVPACVLRSAQLALLDRRTPIIDLASEPGGVDLDAAAQLGCRLIRAPGLPGKVAPASAGAYIRDTVYNLLRRSGGKP